FVVTDFIGEVQAQVFIFDEILGIESLTWARLLEPPLRAIVKQSNTNAVLSNSRTRAVLRHMATEHVMKRNDLHPPIETKLEFGTGVPIPLFNTSVKFIMRGTAGEKVNAPATIINPTLGIVKYDWSLGDTDTAGLYRGEFEIEYPDGS